MQWYSCFLTIFRHLPSKTFIHFGIKISNHPNFSCVNSLQPIDLCSIFLLLLLELLCRKLVSEIKNLWRKQIHVTPGSLPKPACLVTFTWKFHRVSICFYCKCRQPRIRVLGWIYRNLNPCFLVYFSNMVSALIVFCLLY